MTTPMGEPPAGSRRGLWVALALIGVVAVVAVLVAVTRSDDDPGGTVLAGGGTTSTTTEATTTTTTAAPITTTTLAPATTAPVVATTAARPTTTVAPTTTGPARTFRITPNSGPPNTQSTASGTGCTGPDAGVGLTYYDPSGQAYGGDGGAAQPDGTWTIPFFFPSNGPAGRHRVEAKCVNSTTNATNFSYPAATFTVT